MNDKEINLVISTPNGVYYETKTPIVTFTTTEGQIGLMKDATPFLAALVPSQVIIKTKNNQNKIFYIDRGIVEFKNNLLSLIVNNIDTKALDLETKFEKSHQQTRYTVIEELYVKKKVAEQKNNL
ncbi:F0F1 ATP synthase subunit epsilon [Metamycoplasma alkalescens]|uniref:ATP synthase epsilon chain n=2 Tax=Metamycoplasma alkalescens TaxID=45363 RepID=N9SQN1_9BACT|nr:F0F1 ATP synthase subunit epsilon [Metamycoplasma alkalescens]ENY53679.1 ATP synthase epsilon chain [Metamycoplasma alkalescens 14918]PYF43087.1 F-type H+-transporting ATPase subunit epsilon [Metamycoplasma alkalescens]SYV90224.1 ATP synthase subunit epsilon [Metamycoplasma alkalescens]